MLSLTSALCWTEGFERPAVIPTVPYAFRHGLVVVSGERISPAEL